MTREGKERGVTEAAASLPPGQGEVRRGGHLIELSPTEFRLLRYLMLNAAQASLNDPHGLRITLTLPASHPAGQAAPAPRTVSAPA